VPFGQKNAILMTFFTQEKGTLLPEKGHLAKLGLPPGSYAPDGYKVSLFSTDLIATVCGYKVSTPVFGIPY
jgi:hypothetical protein